MTVATTGRLTEVSERNIKCLPLKLKQLVNVKAQINSGAQNEIPKQVRYDKGVILNSFQNPILNFDIHLTFGF